MILVALGLKFNMGLLCYNFNSYLNKLIVKIGIKKRSSLIGYSIYEQVRPREYAKIEVKIITKCVN